MKNPQRPEVNLAIASTRDTASQYQVLVKDLAKKDDSRRLPQRPHSCVLWGGVSPYVPSDVEAADLRLCGCTGEDLTYINSYKIAYILGVHFKAGEWGQHPRCGSVITCVFEGRSLYAVVNRFLHVDGDECPGYASVSWFSEPEYLLRGRTPLVVSVTMDGSEIEKRYGVIVRITQIDPSRIMVESDPENDRYIMMRDSGYDTIRV